MPNDRYIGENFDDEFEIIEQPEEEDDAEEESKQP